MQPLDLLILTLATFYTAYALSSTHGPFGLFERLRAALPLGGLTACMVCLSVWLAAAFYLLLPTVLSPVVVVLAIAGASVFVYRWTGGANL
jgi:uncharacterized protein DUF1360